MNNLGTEATISNSYNFGKGEKERFVTSSGPDTKIYLRSIIQVKSDHYLADPKSGISYSEAIWYMPFHEKHYGWTVGLLIALQEVQDELDKVTRRQAMKSRGREIRGLKASR
ncbi:hypothetical protein L2E82_38054 [Cichorium intybus]|uniref:Uncharacterized protein n=1 Tax=Cichorium intybus TaxID=13427 RepID=A0ACB9AG61_CICIN|nr:hypothetical protein L2E82_38054 [Cichorium intybus]